jgi:hypothetical protein
MNEKDQIFTTTSIEKTEMIIVDEVIVKPYKLFGQSLSN